MPFGHGVNSLLSDGIACLGREEFSKGRVGRPVGGAVSAAPNLQPLGYTQSRRLETLALCGSAHRPLPSEALVVVTLCNRVICRDAEMPKFLSGDAKAFAGVCWRLWWERID